MGNQKPHVIGNTMARRKQTKDQTIIYKTLHRKLKIEIHPHNPPPEKKRG